MPVSALAARLRRPVVSWRRLGRADLAVLGFCALGAGNVWARVGVADIGGPADPGAYLAGVALVVVAAVLCWLASSRPATLPGALVCSAALALSVVGVPEYLVPRPVMFATGLALAAVPLLRSWRAAWLILVAVVAVDAVAVAHNWTWGYVSNDVFAEVQGSTQALLHGQNPYAPLYSVYVGTQAGVPVFGTAAFCYGPMVVLLSIPGRLIGDVRLVALALNLAILAAVLVWTRRHAGGERTLRVVASLWVSSPLIPFMVLMEWTDSFCVAGFAWWLVLRDRHRAWATLALTCALASKPSVLLLMVPMLVWLPGVRREVVWAATATVAVLLPFALWTGVAQFVYDTVLVFADLPARRDAVTLDGVAAILGLAFLPGVLLSAGVVIAGVVAGLRRQRDWGTLLATGSCLVIVVCLLGKQAFLNYYFIAGMGMLLLAGSGAAGVPERLASPLQYLARLPSLSRTRREPATTG